MFPSSWAISAEALRGEANVTNHLEVIFQNTANIVVYYPRDAPDPSASGEPPSTVLIPVKCEYIMMLGKSCVPDITLG